MLNFEIVKTQSIKITQFDKIKKFDCGKTGQNKKE